MNLTEKQQKILDFLNDLQQECKNGLSSLAPILARHDLQSSIGTVCLKTGIIEKENKQIVWNPEFSPINELAIQVDEENNRYYTNRNNITEIKHLVTTSKKTNGHLIEFKLIWPSVGYYRQVEAKRALFKAFTENKDFVVLSNAAQNPNENTGDSSGIGRPAENIYLTAKCALKFAANAQTPMGKEFNQALIDFFYDDRITHLLAWQDVNKDTVLAHQHQEHIQIVKSAQQNITDRREKKLLGDPRQTKCDFGETDEKESLLPMIDSILDLYNLHNFYEKRVQPANGNQAKLLAEAT